MFFMKLLIKTLFWTCTTKDSEKYAFLLQIYFLNKRFQSIKEAYRADNNILDCSIFEDELFLTLNYQNGNVTKMELEIYKELLANMLEELRRDA